jgi:hypothetical protein
MASRLRYDTSKDAGSAKVLPNPPKYAPEPLWQPFPGFSFLFKNPGKSLRAFDRVEQLHIDGNTIKSIPLYSKISAAVDRIDPVALAQRFLFFTLPVSTYHVTVWDGINKGNQDRLNPDSAEKFRKYFAQEIGSAIQAWPPFADICDYRDWFGGLGTIRLRYKGLRARGSTVLVVELGPDDQESDQVLAQIEARRTDLDKAFAICGKPENHSLRPHVAVGYFSNAPLGDSAMFQHMDAWMGVFDQLVRGSVIEFQQIELYAFVDMITYLKPR